jgi:hypothetical protein
MDEDFDGENDQVCKWQMILLKGIWI